ncbi:MAG TPA: hypothetical protein VM537_29715 [Anaerolineae bacterium]|nr:hypothetical protein [Anaerolineae bacterium]
MTYEEVKGINYEDELWTLCDPYPALDDFLKAKDRLIILRHGAPPFQVVLGVPHQAAVGEEHICDERKDRKGRRDPRPSDEGAASYALVAFATLRDRCVPCKLVIMAHATTHDPNKKADSPYCDEVLRDETALLFECHGANPKRRNSLELSAGCNDLSDGVTVPFGQALATALGHRYSLAVQKKACKKDAFVFDVGGAQGEGPELRLAALGTASLLEAKKRCSIPALHLEAKPAFRKPTDGANTVTPDGLLLGRAIARVIIEHVSGTKPLPGLAKDLFIELPHGGPGTGFLASELISHIQDAGRDYIVQGQQKATLADHTKPHSLDVWLRRRFPSRQDTKLADNEVVHALVATGLFQVIKRLPCPDSGRRCKGLRLVDR